MGFDYDLHVFHSPQFKSVVDEAVAFFLEPPYTNCHRETISLEVGSTHCTTRAVMNCMLPYQQQIDWPLCDRSTWGRRYRLDGELLDQQARQRLRCIGDYRNMRGV